MDKEKMQYSTENYSCVPITKFIVEGNNVKIIKDGFEELEETEKYYNKLREETGIDVNLA